MAKNAMEISDPERFPKMQRCWKGTSKKQRNELKAWVSNSWEMVSDQPRVHDYEMRRAGFRGAYSLLSMPVVCFFSDMWSVFGVLFSRPICRQST